MTFPKYWIIVEKATNKFLPYLDPRRSGHTHLPPKDASEWPFGPRRFFKKAHAERCLQVYCRGPKKRYHQGVNAFYDDLTVAQQGFYTSFSQAQLVDPFLVNRPHVPDKFKYYYRHDPRGARNPKDFDVVEATLIW